MNILSRPSKGSPPRRAALHERSESHTNERVSPTLRVIGESQAQVHASSPFPTKPSHILSPKSYDGRGSNFGPGVAVSNDWGAQSEPQDNIEQHMGETASSVPNRSGNTDAHNAFYTSTQETAPESDTSTSFFAMDEDDNIIGRVSDDIVQLPSISPPLESDNLYGAANSSDASRQPVSKDSDASLSSSNSTGTVVVKRPRDGRTRVSYSAFPTTARPNSSKSSLSLSTPQRPTTRDTAWMESPVSPISPSSPVLSSNAMPHERRISSVPMYATLHGSSQNSMNLQYPVIRPPSASASWYVHSDIVPSLAGRPFRATKTVAVCTISVRLNPCLRLF